MDNKNTLVLWSGGFDSTTLIFHYLEHGYHVFALPAIIQNNECQTAAEKYARCQIMTLFEKNKQKVTLLSPTTMDVSLNGSQVSGVTQPIFWLNALYFNVNNPQNPYDVVGFGYVKQDDFWHYKGDFLQTWKSMLGLMNNKCNNIPIEFPFEWETKEELVNKYWRNRKEYFQFISSSERGIHWSIDPDDQDPKNTELRKLWELIQSLTQQPTEEKELVKSDCLKMETVTASVQGDWWQTFLDAEKERKRWQFDWNRPIGNPEDYFKIQEQERELSKIFQTPQCSG